jgi:hypothetical protein
LKSNVPVKHRAPEGLYTVVCSFVVLKDGTISEVMALNDPGYGVAEEAVRVLKKSPKWIPAMQQGKPVTYRQKQSITFEVSEATSQFCVPCQKPGLLVSQKNNFYLVCAQTGNTENGCKNRCKLERSITG